MENESLNQSIDVLSQALKELSEVKNKKFHEKFIDFHATSGESNSGKGILFTGDGRTKQLVYMSDPDRFFVSEPLDIGKGSHLSINKIKVLDEKELGPTVTKSNLRQVGRLRGLLVDGDVVIDNYLFYNSTASRLGFGTDTPHAALSVAEDSVEVIFGTKDMTRGIVGTYACHSFDVVTDNTTRVSVAANGDIQLGNKNFPPINVSLHGSMAINVNTPDNRAMLHVNGAIKFNDKLHLSGTEAPKAGLFNKGDIVWNSEPQTRKYIGWVCVKSGNPGVWASFGEIR